MAPAGEIYSWLLPECFMVPGGPQVGTRPWMGMERTPTPGEAAGFGRSLQSTASPHISSMVPTLAPPSCLGAAAPLECSLVKGWGGREGQRSW